MLPTRLLRPPRLGRFAFQLVQINLGLMLMGFSIAVMLAAHIGLGPLEVFNQGLGMRTGISIGRATQLSGLAVVALTFLVLGTRPGLGTILNMVLVGLWIDLFSQFAAIPQASNWLLAGLQVEAGVALFAFATALYITASLGAGPFDNLMLALERKTHLRVGRIRTAIELALLASGFLLGGTVGAGTVLFAFTVGPILQYFLALLRGRGIDGAAA